MPFRRRYDLHDLEDEEFLDYAVAAREAGDLDAMREALGTFAFGRYRDLLYRAKLKVPAEDAEDVATKAMSDAVLAKFDGTSPGEFWNFLSKVLSRRIADYHDKRSRTVDETILPEEHAGEEDVHTKTAAVTLDPSTGVNAQDVIDQALDSRPPHHRRAIECSLEGQTAEETAKIVNNEQPDLDPPMKPDNVHQIVKRFRDDLKRALEDAS